MSHEFNKTTARSIPDIILIGDDDSMILVENKLFSGEGHLQTERYRAAVPRLAEVLNIPVPTETNLKFIYLTLGGTEAQSPGWAPLSWISLTGDIRTVLDSERIENSTLKLLLNELCERIGWRADLTPPPAQALASFVGNPTSKPSWSSIVDPHLRFFRSFPPEIFPGLKTKYGTTANPGNGLIPLVQALRQTWQSIDARIEDDTPDDQAFGYRTFNVHFELQPRGNRLALMLHHETYPYRMKKFVQGRPELMSGIRDRRHDFERELLLRIHSAPGWQRDRQVKWNNMVSFVRPSGLSTSTSIADLQREISDAVRMLTPIVDETLAVLNS